MNDYQKTLQEIGLSEEQTQIYTTLLERRFSKASALPRHTGITRSMVYKVLHQLEALGLVERHERPNQVDIWSAEHPDSIDALLASKQLELQQTTGQWQGIKGNLVSRFNFLSGRPNIQFFEGGKGVQQVVTDSTNATTEILTIADNEAMNSYYPNINTANRQARQRKNIKKRMLSVDSPYIRNLAQGDDPNITQRRVLPTLPALATAIQIYDHKISYLTLSPDRSIAVIIEDRDLAETQRNLFEILWSQATPIGPHSHPVNLSANK